MLQLYDNCKRTHRSMMPHYEMGIIKFFKGEFQKAFDDVKEFIITLIEKRVQLVTEHTTALLCGMIASEVEEHLLAESCFNFVLEKNPDCKEAYLERSIIRFELGDLDRALEDYISSGIHLMFSEIKSQIKDKVKLLDGIASGFNNNYDISETGAVLLGNFFTDFVDAKVTYLTDGVNPSLDLLMAIVESLEDVRQNHIHEVTEIKSPEVIYLIQNYARLNEYERGQLIGIAIKKCGIGIFSKISGLQNVDFYRSIKKVDHLLSLAELFDSKNLSGK